MPSNRIAPVGLAASITGSAAFISWTFALVQAAPRLLAGPLCSSRGDAWALAGHCPACFVAAGFSLAFLGLLVSDQRRSIAQRIGVLRRTVP